MKRKIFLFLIFLIPFSVVFAQDGRVDVFRPNAGHYLVAIIGGFILAVAFSIILTNLSVAAGLQTISVEPKKGSKKTSHVKDTDKDHKTIGENIRMINNAFGIWSMVTATLALFFASWLATELSLTANPTVGAVISLIIWGLFYIAMMTIEVSALSSLVGSLFRLATSGLKSAYTATASIFTKSDEKKIEDTAVRVTNAVKEEIFGNLDASDIKKQVQTYIEQLKPRPIDPHQIAVEFAKVLNSTEIRAISEDNYFENKETIYAHLKSKGLDESKARNLANKATDIFSIVKSERSKSHGIGDTIINTSLKTAGMSEDEINSTRAKLENYLRSTGKEELDPDAIMGDIENLFHDPKAATSSLKDRLSHINREDIAKALSENTNMTKEQVDARIDKVYSVIEKLKSGGMDYKNGIIEKLRTSIDSLDNPDLKYDDITSDIQMLFHDPKAGAQSLMNRAKSIDRDTIKHFIAQRKDISDEEAEKIIQKFENAKNNVIAKVEQMQHEVERRLEAVKEETLHQAEEARKTASTAAWWAFGTALVSGVGAVLGGILAANTF